MAGESGVPGYRPGDRVHVAQFGKGIVREVRNNGRYLVDLKGRAMEVLEAQLSPVDDTKAHRPSKASHRGESVHPPATQASERGRVITLDLHGHTVEEALQALETCLNDALLDGASEIRVIHGKGEGRLKAAVHEWLKIIGSVRHVHVDPQNQGVTVVTL